MRDTERDNTDIIGADPAAAFDLVANELRFDIVQALWEARTDGETPLSFSTLRERVGVRDSGQFNYHLNKLVPRFVRNDDGYALTHAGQQVVGAAVSGTYTDADVAVEPYPVGSCPSCGTEVTAAYEAGRIVVECDECDLSVADGLPAPPVLAAHHDETELSSAFAGLIRTRIVSTDEGICTLCGGPLDTTPLPFLETDFAFEGDGHIGARHRCRSCGRRTHSALGLSVLYHPAVVGLYHDHGVDVRRLPLWEMDWVSEEHAAVESEAPPRVRVDVVQEDERVRFRLDDDCEVVDYERGPVGEPAQ